MSYFSQTDPLRRKEVGPSLAVDILRGHSSKEADYTIGCLTETSEIKPRNIVAGKPVYSKEMVTEDRTTDLAARDLFILNKGNPFQSPLKPEQAHQLEMDCVPLPEINQDIYLSHRFQRRLSNMTWNDMNSKSSLGTESCAVYENPINRLSLTDMTATAKLPEQEEMSLRGEKEILPINMNTSLLSLEDHKFDKVGHYFHSCI